MKIVVIVSFSTQVGERIWVHPANKHLQYFSREAAKKEKEKSSLIEQRESKGGSSNIFHATRNKNPP